MIKVGIIGGAGYTAGELIRLLVNHRNVELTFIHSESNPGRKVTDIHGGLIGERELKFTDRIDLTGIDCLFMCSGHGASSRFWSEHQRPEHLKVVDLAQDFRDESEGYVYGLPEVNRDKIKTADLVANPGCFATAIQLALLPLAANGVLPGTINVIGVTGSTGAGVKPSATTHFSWRSGNLSVYKAFNHQHLAEIRRTLERVSAGWDGDIDFVPVRGDFPRGIFVMATMRTDIEDEALKKIYSDYYLGSAFTHFVDGEVDLKQVVNTNKAVIGMKKSGNKLLVVSAIDNLLKGASGQAVENMNIMFGLDRREGLRLKALSF